MIRGLDKLYTVNEQKTEERKKPRNKERRRESANGIKKVKRKRSKKDADEDNGSIKSGASITSMPSKKPGVAKSTPVLGSDGEPVKEGGKGSIKRTQPRQKTSGPVGIKSTESSPSRVGRARAEHAENRTEHNNGRIFSRSRRNSRERGVSSMDRDSKSRPSSREPSRDRAGGRDRSRERDSSYRGSPRDRSRRQRERPGERQRDSRSRDSRSRDGRSLERGSRERGSRGRDRGSRDRGSRERGRSANNSSRRVDGDSRSASMSRRGPRSPRDERAYREERQRRRAELQKRLERERSNHNNVGYFRSSRPSKSDRHRSSGRSGHGHSRDASRSPSFKKEIDELKWISNEYHGSSAPIEFNPLCKCPDCQNIKRSGAAYSAPPPGAPATCADCTVSVPNCQCPTCMAAKSGPDVPCTCCGADPVIPPYQSASGYGTGYGSNRETYFPWDTPLKYMLREREEKLEKERRELLEEEEERRKLKEDRDIMERRTEFGMKYHKMQESYKYKVCKVWGVACALIILVCLVGFLIFIQWTLIFDQEEEEIER